MSASKCPKCGFLPSVMPTGMAQCHRCGITARSVEQWNAFSSAVPQPDWKEFYEMLESPLHTLNAIAAMTDDEGIARLAQGQLLKLHKLDIAKFFTDVRELDAHTDWLKSLRENTGAAHVKKRPIPR